MRLPRFNVKRLVACVFIPTLLVGCSTRQVSPTLEGSTAQRLVTLSLDKFIAALAKEPEVSALEGESVHLNVFFLENHPLTAYATRLLEAQLQMNHDVNISEPSEPAAYDLDVFFNSIGTDSDTFGLTIPTLGVATTADGTIDILALDMFHGITEGYAIVTADNGSMERTERVLARIRRDNVSTPIIDFPLNQVD